MGNKLNTVAKGDAFENIVFSKMKELLESDMLGLSSKHSKIFQKKAYYGKTGNEIIFDIAIESYHPDSDECSTLTLIECKDYKYPIQVDKLRSFASSINDVGGNKGYFITTSHFQEGAINHARSYKIGLARFNMQNLDIDQWVLRRVGLMNYQKQQAIQEELYFPNDNTQNAFVAVCGYDCYSNFIDFISEQFIGESCKINVNYLSDEVIQSKVADLVTKMQYPPNILRSTDFLIDLVSKQLNLQLLKEQPLSYGELGICNFSQRTISISPELQYDSPRWRFTLAHEIGHFVLHESICSPNMINSISDDETSINSITNNKAISRLEIQANKFAVHLLVPEELFKIQYAIKHKQLDIPRFPFLYLDDQPCNRQDCFNIFSYLAKMFNISNEVVKIKLKNMKLLTVDDSVKSIRDLIL